MENYRPRIFSLGLIGKCGGNVIKVMNGKPSFLVEVRGRGVHIVFVKNPELAKYP
jgi:hypothetical protein